MSVVNVRVPSNGAVIPVRVNLDGYVNDDTPYPIEVALGPGNVVIRYEGTVKSVRDAVASGVVLDAVVKASDKPRKGVKSAKGNKSTSD